MADLVIRRGTGPVRTHVDPAVRPHWHHTGLEVVEIGEEAYEITADGRECVVVPLATQGEWLLTPPGAKGHVMRGRPDPYDHVPSCCYIGTGDRFTLSGPGRYAIAYAPTDVHRPSAPIPAEQVAVAPRGAGTASRLVRNITFGGDFTGVEKILVCEVVTPGGNWSSYPAHKHDEHTATERELEEIYYYEIADGPDGQPGFGYHQTTSTDPQRPIDVLTEVRTGDTVLVPHGWHGPCVAAPGHDMYYLNVMAGPAADGQWLITDHPDQTWVRDLWPHQPVDSRVEDRR